MRAVYGVLLGLMVLARVGWAEEACFCLKDAHDNWMKGCQKRPHGVAQQPTTFCEDTVSGVLQRVNSERGWTRVSVNEDGCTPCQDTRTRSSTGPRSGDKTTGEQPHGADSGDRPGKQ
jgi:hypothetical protein